MIDSLTHSGMLAILSVQICDTSVTLFVRRQISLQSRVWEIGHVCSHDTCLLLWSLSHAAGSWKSTYKDVLRILSSTDLLQEMEFAVTDQWEHDLNDDGYQDDLGMGKLLYKLVISLAATEIKDCRQYEVHPYDKLQTLAWTDHLKDCLTGSYYVTFTKGRASAPDLFAKLETWQCTKRILCSTANS